MPTSSSDQVSLLGTALTSFLFLAACAEPAEWELDYDRALDHSIVSRLDLTIEPGDFQAMQEDMESKLGEAGSGGGHGDVEIPPKAIEACEGLEVGDECSVTTPMGEVEGICVEMLGEVFCMPEDDSEYTPDTGGDMEFFDGDPIYVPATVLYEHEEWKHVGIRYKGNSSLSSLWREGCRKLPFRLDFDHFDEEHPRTDGQRMFGFEKMTYSPSYGDDSQVREAYVAELFDELGLAAARWAFVEVHVDVGEGPEYWGLYTAIEDPSDDPMLDRIMGDDEINVYKPAGPSADWTEFVSEDFVKKTNESEADWSDVIAAMEALHASQEDPEAWRVGLEAHFDAEAFLWWLAASTVIENWDSYGIFAHNYYLYGDPESGGRLMWVPWDHNYAMQPSPMISDSPTTDVATVFHTEVDEQWPLIQRLLADPVYSDLYEEAVVEIVDGAFAQDRAVARIQELHDLVEAPVRAEEEGSRTISSIEAFEASVDDLVEHIAMRHALVEAALEALEP